MKARPIIFNGDMVRALLDGRKTQTRRVVKNIFTVDGHDCVKDVDGMPSRLDWAPRNWEVCPYGQPGDLLWVRETWGLHDPLDETCWFRGSLGGRTLDELTLHWSLVYTADWGANDQGCRWRPSIHMPRWASRLTLRITEVRVQRLQEISEDDARAEGVTGSAGGPWGCEGLLEDFETAWDSIHGDGAWDHNPWVWAITFEVIRENVDQVLARNNA